MKKIKLAIPVILVVLLIGVILTGGCSSASTTSSATTLAQTSTQVTASNPITLVFSGQEMAGGIYVTGFFEPWFAAIEQKTGGKVKIEAHWGEELVKSADSFMAVKTGIVDMAQVPVDNLPTDFPMDQVLSFISYDTTCYGISQAYWELYNQYPEIQKEYDGTKLIWLGAAGTSYLGTVKKQVKTLEDMQGLKVMGKGGWDTDRWKALGAVPVTVGPADFFTSLQNGILDGTAFAPFTLRDFKVGDVVHYITVVPVGTTLFSVVVNSSKWNSIPADLQNIIIGMTPDYIKINDDYQNKLAKERLDAAPQEFSIQMFTPSSQELARWVALDTPVLDKFIAQLNSKGLPGDSLKTKFLELEKKYAASQYAPK